MTLDKDQLFMNVALNYARRGLGFVKQGRPSVGCVLVRKGSIVAAARTGDGGQPHAEVAAIEIASYEAKGATAYVTLEPCAHQGRTPPCADALIEAGIVRCVVACRDPFPQVNGKGIEILQKAGIEVVEGVCEEEARLVNAGFFLTVEEKRPYVTCKLMVSADGKIASAPGERTMISGDIANRHTHLQRSRHDAILVGSETYLVDQPQLTTRVKGIQHKALKVVLDGQGRVKNADGYEVITDKTVNTKDIKAVLAYLALKGVTRLLVEGGTKVHKSFLESGFVDEFQLCTSPHRLGGEGVLGLTKADIEASNGLKHQKTRVLGEDTLEIYARAD